MSVVAGSRSKAGFTLNMMASTSPERAASFATWGLWVESPMCSIVPAAFSSRT